MLLHRKRQIAFTLIELLVVITIIAILMGLLFPAFRGVQDQAKKAQAKNDEQQIVTAVTAFYTDYGKYPLADNKQGYDTLYGDPGGTYPNEDVFNTLRAIASGVNSSDQLNPKRVVFFSGNNVKDADHPRGGFSSKSISQNGFQIGIGAYVDPWGATYMIAIDGNYDGSTADYLPYNDVTYQTDSQGQKVIRAGAFSASFGKDNKKGTSGDGNLKGSDDVVSWQ